ncbi:MAG: amidohydrolase [Bacteroidales bacterium]|nr:amidohydrolase [Bacteroidales bacterium]
MKTKNNVLQATDDIIDLRLQLHQHPQVSGKEVFAQKLILAQLAELHPDKVYEKVGSHGVIAVWGDESKPCVAFRADMDALPSGHRCGHDGHMAILLRMAQHIDQNRQNLKNTILLCFQPEEETGFGANKIIKSGILQSYNTVAIFGFHNIPAIKAGDLVFNRHTFTSASTGICFHLDGTETHASTPERGKNPGAAVADIIGQMNRSSSPYADIHNIDTYVQATLAGIKLGGENYGIAAGRAEMYYTLRAYTDKNLSDFLANVRYSATAIAHRHNLVFHTSLHESFNAIENSTYLVDHLVQLAQSKWLTIQVLDEPFRWSEDFANYLAHWPGAYFGVGAGLKHPELHSPEYEFPDSIIESTALFLYNVAQSQIPVNERAN